MKPNVVVILPDQLRRNALSAYGDPNVRTPAIDTLAAEGVRFTAACSTYPVCVPFRFTLLTGEYAHTRYVPCIEWRMSPAEKTLADEFAEAGYETMYIGKWHLYGGNGLLPNQHTRKPIPSLYRRNWQVWRGFELINSHFESYYYENDANEPTMISGYQTDGLFSCAIECLRSRDRSRPFFCVLSPEPPHFPFQAPEELQSLWRDRELVLPPNFLAPDAAPAPGWKANYDDRDLLFEKMRTYYAMIENLDNNVARLRNCLSEEGVERETIIVLISDHGQMDGAHCEKSHQKEHPYEESIGIPFIVSDPRLAHRAGTMIPDVVCTEDLFPTILGLAGLKPDSPKPGTDLSPLIAGRIDKLQREGVYLELVHDLRRGEPFAYHDSAWRGYRTKRWKYTVLGGYDGGGKPWQLFDLSNDPYEMRNLIHDREYEAVAGELHGKLRARLVETADHFPLAPAFRYASANL